MDEEGHAYPLLIKPGSEITKTPSSGKSLSAAKRVESMLQTARRNFVETENGYIMSTIDKVISAPYNYMQNSEQLHVTLDSKTVEFSVTRNEIDRPQAFIRQNIM
jgi:hypothetical protein